MKIGKYVFPHGLVLAPMAGVTDTAFRRICKRFGAELVVSEMISAKGLHYSDQKTRALSAHTTEENPIAVQLFGSEADIMAEAATYLRGLAMPPQIIDINMGCPMRKIVTNGDGSALMREPKRAAEIVTAMVKAVDCPITVKFRTGWDEAHKNAVEFAKHMEAAGASAITIHGRTKEQLYAPPVDFATIEAVCHAVSIPVIGNGGIETADDAARMYNLGCAGVALARGAVGRPWLFSEIIASREHKVAKAISVFERFSIAKEHLAFAVEAKGEGTAVREMRPHLAAYLHGLVGAASARNAVNGACSVSELHAILDEVANAQPTT